MRLCRHFRSNADKCYYASYSPNNAHSSHLEVVSQSDRHGRINKRQSEECEHEFGIEIISFIKLSKTPINESIKVTPFDGYTVFGCSPGHPGKPTKAPLESLAKNTFTKN